MLGELSSPAPETPCTNDVIVFPNVFKRFVMWDTHPSLRMSSPLPENILNY